MTNHTAEAQKLIDGMASQRDRLTVQDRRFVAMWRFYFDTKGELANVNELNLASIQTRAAAYGLCQSPAPMASRSCAAVEMS